MSLKNRIIIGISGASGAIYGVRLLEVLKALPVETHLVMSKAAEMTLAYETDLKPAAVRALADVAHGFGDVGAPIASGSFRTMGMVIAPCSVHSMAEIATGVTSNLLTRAADVTLKERRRLVHAAGDAAPHGAPAQHDRAVRDGRHHRAAGAGLLCPAGVGARHRRSQRGARARSLRPGNRSGAALGRAAGRGRRSRSAA
jgi:hypothetical protein